jgi:hypothetical protein
VIEPKNKGRFHRGIGKVIVCACGHGKGLHQQGGTPTCGCPTKWGTPCACPLTPDQVVDMYNVCGVGVDL